ncbi:glucose repression mediator protein, partial [Linnemannia gamsii]
MSANGPPAVGPPPPNPPHAPGNPMGPGPGPGGAPPGGPVNAPAGPGAGGPPGAPPGPGGAPPAQQQQPQQPPIISPAIQHLDAIDEQVWLQLGSLAESMGEHDRALNAYESALRHNYHSVAALTLIAELHRTRENFPKAADYFQRVLAIDGASGEAWGSLGHCYLMMDELQKAYNAYQNALHHLPNPKDSKLWYGIGILYDRYGSVEHAEEAFSAVMRMDPKSDKANEIYFRLGIIYKGQQKYSQSLECFRYILHAPPRPLTEADIWFQIGHVHEQQKEYTSAKDAYEHVLAENPNHAKVLQQLGWLYHQQQASFMDQDLAITFLTRSIESDNTDAQSWYLMGRCYMAQQNFSKAYEAYQQAVYRDSRNPTFWCSIGLLYFQINQFRDALDAYSKAIRINPNISEVWYDLGTLYEACNNQVQDAIDAYQRASDLDPENPLIKQRLDYLRQNNGGQGGGMPPPHPEGMNPSRYQSMEGPNGQNVFGQGNTVAPQGPPTGMQGYTDRPYAPPAPL